MIKMYSKLKIKPNVAIINKIEVETKLIIFNQFVTLLNLIYLPKIAVKKYRADEDINKIKAKSDDDLNCLIP